jgi:mono/diheme cytochrome c family protein
MRALLLALALLATSPALADAPAVTFGSPSRFTESTGPAIYAAVCAGCHMPDGRGAAGAAAYPPLADDPRLAAAAYPITRVLRGHGAMPAFGRMLSDDQVAAVVAFIRTAFGNTYAGPATARDVAALR